MFTHRLGLLKPVQKLAFKRICDAQEAMTKHGIFPRYATELEFVPLGENGKPIWNAISIDEFKGLFKGSAYVSEVMASGDTSFFTNRNLFRQFEIGINGNGFGRDVPLVMPDVRLSPKTIIPATDVTKRLLKARAPDFGIHEISFRPVESGIYSGYHTNMSLYNAKGENLCAKSSSFFAQCAHDMLQSQAEGAFLMLPTQESFGRIAKPHEWTFLRGTPSRVTHTYGKASMLTGEFGTLSSRQYSVLSPIYQRLRKINASADELFKSIAENSPDGTRLESRLADMHSCPYLQGALEMATLQATVEKGGLEIHKAPKLPTFSLPHSVEEAAQTFAKSERMQQLLGKDLHAAAIGELLGRELIGTISHLR